jgi:DMSO/TMAO reductase YedYZ molybdopterin-dependent catalytic subunit
MIVRSKHPEDLEMPISGFRDFITPVDHFFVRTHVTVPAVDVGSWRLEVDGNVSNPLSLTMNDLRSMPSFELVGVLECAGNGRSFYEPTMAGAQWKNGAVGNGRWRGVRLQELLKKAGLKPGSVEVLFDGEDLPLGTMPDFQRSLPMKKAMDPGTLLAYEMNGTTLPPKHGFPLRAIVPGWTGNSWVKWVKSVRVLSEPANGFWMKGAYLMPLKTVPPGTVVSADAMAPVTSLHVKSIIALPVPGTYIDAGRPVVISGAAWSGEAGSVVGVDVSSDRGRTWKPARLTGPTTQFGWRLWEFPWTPATEGRYTILSRARDSAGNVQPLLPEWNPNGYLWNAVARVDIDAGRNPNTPPATAAVPAAREPQGFQERCLTCHEEDVIRQQHLSGGQWDRELNKMMGWGARVEPETRQTLLDYLLSIAGPSR